MIRKALVVGAVTGALAAAGTASAGCFATAGISLPPGGLGAGEAWTAKLTVLQHGVTPMPDARPRVIIRNAKTGEQRTFAARPVDSHGHYAARVVFPARGSWRLSVHDGFAVKGYADASLCAQTHSFGAVSIGGKPPAGAPSSPPSGTRSPAPAPAPAVSSEGPSAVWPIAAAALAVLALASVALVVRRQAKAPATR